MLIHTPAEAPTTDRVRTALSGAVVAGRPLRAEEIAHRLGFSAGHLRRKLRAEGTTLVAVRDDVLRDRAVAALRRGDGVGLIAHRLGFTDARSFRRAFKRWTGAAPSTFFPG